MSRQFPALRGAAILLVVLNHAIVLSLDSVRTGGFATPPSFERLILVALKSLGPIAVPVFLFLSGGFLAYALRDKPIGPAYRAVALGLRHILVPYVLWSLVFYALIFVLNRDVYTPVEYAKYLLVGYPFNFVPILIAFYAISPILVRWIGARPWPTLLAIGAYQIFSIAALQPDMLGVTFPAWTTYLTIPGLRLTVAIWAIFFPLGMAFGLHAEGFRQAVERWRWPLLAGTLALYLLVVADEAGALVAPQAVLALPLLAVLLVPVVRREAIPFVRSFEYIGRRAFGLYLTNLIFLNLVLVAVQAFVPGLLQAVLVLVPLGLALTVGALVAMAAALERWPGPAAQRYVFG
ncbi:MAG TPA: acyltransferase [Anaerolineales bacterium]|nr:acyltransferase [Anaerolineales bacterium]